MSAFSINSFNSRFILICTHVHIQQLLDPQYKIFR